MTIKGQALADFIAEFTYTDTTEVARTTNDAEVAKLVDIANNDDSATGREDTK